MPGFNEMEKHFYDFNKPIRKQSKAIESIKDGLSSFGGMFIDIGYGVGETVYDNRLEARIRKETQKLEIVCAFAKTTNNKVFVVISNKYDSIPCSAHLITDGSNHWLIETRNLKNLMMQGVLVVSGAGIANYLNEPTIIKKELYNRRQYQWIITPVEFNKEHCSNLREIYNIAKQHM